MRRLVLGARDGCRPEVRKRELRRLFIPTGGGNLHETVKHETWRLVLAAGDGDRHEVRKRESRRLP